MVLAFVALALLLITGLVSLRIALRLLGMLVFVMIFILPLVKYEHKEIVLLVGLGIVLALLLIQRVIGSIFGRGPANSVIGSFLSTILLVPFRLVMTSIRAVLGRGGIR